MTRGGAPRAGEGGDPRVAGEPDDLPLRGRGGEAGLLTPARAVARYRRGRVEQYEPRHRNLRADLRPCRPRRGGVLSAAPCPRAIPACGIQGDGTAAARGQLELPCHHAAPAVHVGFGHGRVGRPGEFQVLLLGIGDPVDHPQRPGLSGQVLDLRRTTARSARWRRHHAAIALAAVKDDPAEAQPVDGPEREFRLAPGRQQLEGGAGRRTGRRRKHRLLRRQDHLAGVIGDPGGQEGAVIASGAAWRSARPRSQGAERDPQRSAPRRWKPGRDSCRSGHEPLQIARRLAAQAEGRPTPPGGAVLAQGIGTRPRARPGLPRCGAEPAGPRSARSGRRAARWQGEARVGPVLARVLGDEGGARCSSVPVSRSRSQVVDRLPAGGPMV